MKRLFFTETMVSNQLRKRVFDATTGFIYEKYPNRVEVTKLGQPGKLTYLGKEAGGFWRQLTNEGKYIRD